MSPTLMVSSRTCDWCGKPARLVLTKFGTRRPACAGCARSVSRPAPAPPSAEQLARDAAWDLHLTCAKTGERGCDPMTSLAGHVCRPSGPRPGRAL